MANSLVGALVSRHAVIATAAIARPTIRIVVTVQSCIEVRKQDTRKKINPDAAFCLSLAKPLETEMNERLKRHGNGKSLAAQTPIASSKSVQTTKPAVRVVAVAMQFQSTVQSPFPRGVPLRCECDRNLLQPLQQPLQRVSVGEPSGEAQSEMS